MSNFWQQLKDKKVQTGKPFFVLAPMADVTDSAFRLIVSQCSKPDVLWTEFVAADGLVHPKGREKLMYDLRYSQVERPIVAQLFSSNPANMQAASLHRSRPAKYAGRWTCRTRAVSLEFRAQFTV